MEREAKHQLMMFPLDNFLFQIRMCQGSRHRTLKAGNIANTLARDNLGELNQTPSLTNLTQSGI